MVAQLCNYQAQFTQQSTPLTANGAGIDIGRQPDTDQAGLL